jgi:hypothetical protein
MFAERYLRSGLDRSSSLLTTASSSNFNASSTIVTASLNLAMKKIEIIIVASNHLGFKLYLLKHQR